MKTLKQLLKKLLSNYSNSNNSQNETETHENDRDPDMVSPPSQENGGDAEKQKPEISGLSGNLGQPEPDDSGDHSGKRGIEAALEEAYQRGVIDGRNQKIDAVYFSDKENVPHLRGSAYPQSPSSDIFSMARNA